MIQQASLYQPIFSFSAPEFKQNRLVDKMVPAVEVDTNANTVKCKDGDAQVSIVRAQYPLPTNGLVAFFQVEVIKCSSGHLNECGLNVGLITKDGNPRAYAGKYMNSIGYVNGEIYLNKKKISTVSHLGKKERMGCGINCSNGSFFFTKNSQIVAKNITLPEGCKWNEFFPAVALQHQDETVKCYFEKKEFMFDIQKIANQIQQQIQGEIFNDQSQEEISSSEVYSLISEYMLFNGYSKTLQMMKQKHTEIQFEPINKLTKSIPGTNVVINLDQQNTKMKEELQEGENHQSIGNDNENQNQKQQQLQEIKPIPQQSKLKSRMRQRIMSQVQPHIMPEESLMVEEENQPRRKNTQMGQQSIPSDYKMRKQSNISNLSLADDESFHHNIMEQKVHNQNQVNNHSKNSENLFQESLSLNERFLLNQRLEILSFIKEKKIQCAQKIIKEKIPKIYEVQPLLQPYMKAHIFLRKIIEQDQNSAISYGRTEEKFAKNIDKLFPTYDAETGSIEMIPMKKILTSIVASKSKEHKFLKKQQFEYFAEYVNSLIMKWMGVMGNSRLGVILQHTSIVLRKLQQFKGMSCGIKLLN